MNKRLEKNVSAFIEKSGNIVKNYDSEVFKINIGYGLLKIESPIEQIFKIAFETVIRLLKDDIDVSKYLISHQVKIGRYIIDFIVYDKRKNKKGKYRKVIAVECDGHDFHDKNKQQRIYEKTRDRYLQSKGLKVLHYTGTEIVQNPYFVASEVFGFLDKEISIENLMEAINCYG